MEDFAEALLRHLQRAQEEEISVGQLLREGLYLTVFAGGRVVNITARTREPDRQDVDAVRAALAEIGYIEIKSWAPTQGASWLSPGLPAGASFEVRPKHLGAKLFVRAGSAVPPRFAHVDIGEMSEFDASPCRCGAASNGHDWVLRDVSHGLGILTCSIESPYPREGC